ncbi:MAG: hypothetical protein WD009_04965 [Phycisphaeraceae bacterium]
MNAFQPPTDNLYKFVALAGVFLCVFSVAVQYHYRLQLNELVLEAERNLAVLEVQTEWQQTEVADLEELVRQADKRHAALMDLLHNDHDEDELEAERVLAMAEQIQERIEHIRRGDPDNQLLQRLAAARLRALTDEIRYLNWERLKVGVVGAFGLGVGIVLAWWGFRRWYLRSQVFLDQQLHMSVNRIGNTSAPVADPNAETSAGAPTATPPSP